MLEDDIFGSSVTVAMNYRDAPAAIEWLCAMFGFKKHVVFPGPNNTILHSELILGRGMIMVASLNKDSDYNRFMRHPQEIAGAETRSVNLIVSYPDAIFRRVRESGAEILCDIEDKHYGGRGFTCRDPEDYIWNVASYNPWQSRNE